ncbi:DTW domain-containing protein [bacterium]|nr:DTW domain-containing protein [bacterium]
MGTGRMAHRSLTNSLLWVGASFGRDSELAALLAQPGSRPFLLYPGPRSLSLDTLTAAERERLLPAGEDPVLIVLDATWDLAQKMLHHSPILQDIPRVSFESRETSRFLIRKQPRPECLSSLEAIHRVLTLLRDPADHSGMLRVFDQMVERQLAYSKK